DEFHLSPDGHRVAITSHGEIFTAPVTGGDLVQITDNPSRDKEPSYSPDGKHIAFISDRSGREEIYVTAADASGDPQKIADNDSMKVNINWSPDSKLLSYMTTEDKIYVYDTAAKQSRAVASSKYGAITGGAWSPDGKWIAYAKADQTRNTDIFLVSPTGGAEHKVTFDSYSERQPRFSADGKKLYFTLSEGGGFGPGGGRGAQLWVVSLEKLDKDPDDNEGEADQPEQPTGAGGRGGRGNAAAPA